MKTLYKKDSGYKISYTSRSGKKIRLIVGKFKEKGLEKIAYFDFGNGEIPFLTFRDYSYYGARFFADGVSERFIGKPVFELLTLETKKSELEDLASSKTNPIIFLYSVLRMIWHDSKKEQQN